MRSSLIILPLATLLACGGGSYGTGPGTTGGTNNPPGGGGSNPVATTAVSMKNTAFTPEAIKVASGATVTWTNNDGFRHDVVFDGNAVPDSGPIDAGVAKPMTMPTAAGTYNYHCSIHGTAMSGSVQVQ